MCWVGGFGVRYIPRMELICTRAECVNLLMRCFLILQSAALAHSMKAGGKCTWMSRTEHWLHVQPFSYLPGTVSGRAPPSPVTCVLTAALLQAVLVSADQDSGSLVWPISRTGASEDMGSWSSTLPLTNGMPLGSCQTSLNLKRVYSLADMSLHTWYAQH